LEVWERREHSTVVQLVRRNSGVVSIGPRCRHIRHEVGNANPTSVTKAAISLCHHSRDVLPINQIQAEPEKYEIERLIWKIELVGSANAKLELGE
ncbi:hypothetical protein NLO77_25185, partial [Escherichia coli]|nr:hypothetical protein [Escherichia coli]